MDADLPQVFTQSRAEASHYGRRHLGFPVSRTGVGVSSPEFCLSGRLRRAFRKVRSFLEVFWFYFMRRQLKKGAIRLKSYIISIINTI